MEQEEQVDSRMQRADNSLTIKTDIDETVDSEPGTLEPY